jgi:hypothetical protein
MWACCECPKPNVPAGTPITHGLCRLHELQGYEKLGAIHRCERIELACLRLRARIRRAFFLARHVAELLRPHDENVTPSTDGRRA